MKMKEAAFLSVMECKRSHDLGDFVTCNLCHCKKLYWYNACNRIMLLQYEGNIYIYLLFIMYR
jgi:hypothetical protein